MKLSHSIAVGLGSSLATSAIIGGEHNVDVLALSVKADQLLKAIDILEGSDRGGGTRRLSERLTTRRPQDCWTDHQRYAISAQPEADRQFVAARTRGSWIELIVTVSAAG